MTHTGRASIPVVESERDLRFRDIVIRPKGIVELMLRTPETFCDISVLMNVANFTIPALLGLDALYGNSLLAENVTGYLCIRVIISGQLLRYDDRWVISRI